MAAAHLFVVYYFSKQGNTVAKFCKCDGRRANAKSIETRRSAFKTLNGRLPPEDGSDWAQTLPERVSDDSRHLIFRRPENFLDEIFGAKNQREIKDGSFWRSYEFLSINSRFSLKSNPKSPKSLRSLAKGLKDD